jgi:hypothetical protein
MTGDADPRVEFVISLEVHDDPTCLRPRVCDSYGLRIAFGRAPRAGSGAAPRVTVCEQISGTQAIYHYHVENRGSERSIGQLWVGYTDLEGATLPEPPAGWTLEAGIPAANATSPPGWTVEGIKEEEATRYSVIWRSAENDPSTDIPPNHAVGNFSATLPTPVVQYLRNWWLVVLDNGQTFEGPLEARSALLPAEDLLGTLVINGDPLTLQFLSPEQNARVWFYAESKRIRLSVTAAAPCAQVLIRSPQGGTITSRIFAADGTLDAVLSDTGNYHLYVDPPNSLLSAADLAACRCRWRPKRCHRGRVGDGGRSRTGHV